MVSYRPACSRINESDLVLRVWGINFDNFGVHDVGTVGSTAQNRSFCLPDRQFWADAHSCTLAPLHSSAASTFRRLRPNLSRKLPKN